MPPEQKRTDANMLGGCMIPKFHRVRPTIVVIDARLGKYKLNLLEPKDLHIDRTVSIFHARQCQDSGSFLAAKKFLHIFFVGEFTVASRCPA